MTNTTRLLKELNDPKVFSLLESYWVDINSNDSVRGRPSREAVDHTSYALDIIWLYCNDPITSKHSNLENLSIISIVENKYRAGYMQFSRPRITFEEIFNKFKEYTKTEDWANDKETFISAVKYVLGYFIIKLLEGQ